MTIKQKTLVFLSLFSTQVEKEEDIWFPKCDLDIQLYGLLTEIISRTPGAAKFPSPCSQLRAGVAEQVSTEGAGRPVGPCKVPSHWG